MEVPLTLAEASAILNPPLSEKQLRQLVGALGWQPTGARHDGRPGHPRATYNASEILRLHAAVTPFLKDHRQ